MPFFNLSLLLALFGLAACADQADRAPAEAGTASSTSEAAIPYRVDAPDAVIVHSEVLEEASALTVLPNGHLATLHDEEGVIFEIDPATGDIVNETAFEGPGDFEGLEWVDGVFWALRSDGTLFRVAEGEPMQVFQTHLTEDSDTEGLGWDPTTGRLLIACKEDPGGELQGVRAVYAFDPEEKIMDAFPALMLPRDRVDTDEEFRPSAIAVHPIRASGTCSRRAAGRSPWLTRSVFSRAL